MPTTPLPENLTKISYILDRKQKDRLAKEASKRGVSMSRLITDALVSAGILASGRKAA